MGSEKHIERSPTITIVLSKSTTVAIILSFLVGTATYWLIDLPTKYLFALALSVVTFSLIKLCSLEKPKTLIPWEIKLHPEFIIPVLWVASIIFCMLIGPFSAGGQYVDWASIPVLNWIRLAAALLLTTFFPGYGLLTITFKDECLNRLEKGLISVHLSLFLSVIIPLFDRLLEGRVAGMSTIFVILLNSLLLVGTLLRFHGKPTRANRKIRLSFADLYSLSIIASLILLYTLSVQALNFPAKFVAGLDQWKTYGSILRLIDGFSNARSSFFNYVAFQLFNSLFLVACGLPFRNAYMALFILIVLPILSFYLFCTSFLSKRHAATGTVIYALFTGLGGLYAIYMVMTSGMGVPSSIIQVATHKTLDLFTGIQDRFFFYTPRTIGFSSLFMLLYLVHRHYQNTRAKVTVMGFIFALGYLSHVREASFLVFVMPFILLLYKKHLAKPLELPVSVGIGLLTASVLMPLFIHAQLIHPYFLTRLSVMTQLPILGAITAISYVFLRFNFTKLFRVSVKKTSHLYTISFLFAVAVLYILIISLIVWYWSLPSLSVGAVGEIVPWYLYPLRLGFPLFMAVISVPWLIRQGNLQALKLGLIITIPSVALARLINYLSKINFQYPTLEVYIAQFIWIGLAILSSFILAELPTRITKSSFSRFRFVNKFCIALIWLFILVGGFSSTLLTIRGYSGMQIQPPEELKTMDYIRSLTHGNDVIATPSFLFIHKIFSFTGRCPLGPAYVKPFFGTNNPEHFFNILHGNRYTFQDLQIKYIALPKVHRLSENLQQYENGFVMGHLTKHLRPIFEDESIILYEIPSFSPPSPVSDFAFMRINTEPETYIYPLVAISMAQLNYTVALPSDWKLLTEQFSTMLLPADLEQFSLEKILEWVSGGKTLIVFDSLGHDGNFSRPFENLLSIRVATTDRTLVDGIKGLEGEVNFPPITTPMHFSIDDDVVPVAFYTKDGEPISPYAFSKKVGNGKIIYVEIYPFYGALKTNSENSISSLYANLGGLIDVLGLPLQKFDGSSRFSWHTLIYGSIFLDQAELKPSGFIIPDLHELDISLNASQTDQVMVNGSNINRRMFNDVRIEDFHVEGNFKPTFVVPQSKITKGLGSYLGVDLSQGFHLTLELDADTVIHLVVREGGQTFNVTIKGGTFTLHSQRDVSIYMKGLRVSANSVRFGEYFLGRPSKFIVISGDNSSILTSDVNVNGMYVIQPRKTVHFDEWDIPASLLSYSILLAAAMVTISIFVLHPITITLNPKKQGARTTRIMKELGHEVFIYSAR